MILFFHLEDQGHIGFPMIDFVGANVLPMLLKQRKARTFFMEFWILHFDITPDKMYEVDLQKRFGKVIINFSKIITENCECASIFFVNCCAYTTFKYIFGTLIG